MIKTSFTNDEKWIRISYHTTWKNGWEEILAFVSFLNTRINNAEILTSSIVGDKTVVLSKDITDDILSIPEAGVMIIRGTNPEWDNAPTMFTFINQSDVVTFDIPTSYYLSERFDNIPVKERESMFDNYMNSVEILGFMQLAQRRSAKAIVEQISEALTNKQVFTEELIYRHQATGVSLNLTKLAKSVVETYGEVYNIHLPDEKHDDLGLERIQTGKHFVEVICPSCGNKFSTDDSDISLGETYEVRCTKCGSLLKRKKL